MSEEARNNSLLLQLTSLGFTVKCHGQLSSYSFWVPCMDKMRNKSFLLNPRINESGWSRKALCRDTH